MNKHIALFITPLITLVAGIIYFGNVTVDVPGALIAMFSVMSIGAYLFTFMFFNTLTGYRVFGWWETLKNWRIYVGLSIIGIFLGGGLFFATAQSGFPQDDLRQHFFGWSLVAACILGCFYPILTWHYYGYADELSYRQSLHAKGMPVIEIDEECEKLRSQGIFAPRE